MPHARLSRFNDDEAVPDAGFGDEKAGRGGVVLYFPAHLEHIYPEVALVGLGVLPPPELINFGVTFSRGLPFHGKGHAYS